MTEPRPPKDPLPPCSLCGSTEHTSVHHDAGSEYGHHDGSAPPDYATEPVMVDDDDD